MTDIIERLRTHHRWPVEAHHDALEAADMIQSLLGHIDLLHDEIEHQRERITWLQEQIEDLQKEKA